MRNPSTLRKLSPTLVSLLKPQSPAAARYQRLRLMVEGLANPDHGVVIAIASPANGEGKTLTCINLAGALAQNSSNKVLVMSVDLRSGSPSVSDFLSQPCSTGLSSLNADNCPPWQEWIRKLPEFNLDLMATGAHSMTPYEVLNSPKLEALIETLRQHYDYIIVDTAAVTLFPDTQLVSKWVDRFIILVAAGMTSEKQLEECLNLMTANKVLGFVFNEPLSQAGNAHER